MLTEVKAYSSWHSAPELLLDANGRPETDFLQIRNIEGLDPIKASVNTSPYGSIDGASYVGSSVLTRNLVLTLHPNPDWDVWSFEALRRIIYAYFMPKRAVRLVFYSDDIPPVEISGIVEDTNLNLFSKDPEYQISVICPDPYFTALNPTVITGQTVREGATPIVVPYNGSIESGMTVKVTSVIAPDPTNIQIQIGDPALTLFEVEATVSPTMYFEMGSIPTMKYVQNINIGTGVITNLLSKAHIREGSSWPILQPGDNDFQVITDQGTQDWELSFYERYGGL